MFISSELFSHRIFFCAKAQLSPEQLLSGVSQAICIRLDIVETVR